jgi:hypothetical protein
MVKERKTIPTVEIDQMIVDLLTYVQERDTIRIDDDRGYMDALLDLKSMINKFTKR